MRSIVWVVVLAAGCKNAAQEVHEKFESSKREVTRKIVEQYAEAYLHWSLGHPSTPCPSSLSDLDDYMNHPYEKDPWGSDYKMLCGANLPPGVTGLAVYSLGGDKKDGTADDIKSWWAVESAQEYKAKHPDK
jgi:hypothetical protein